MRYVLLICCVFALIVAAEWQPEERLTNNNYSDFSYWSSQRRVVVDQAGRVHVAWYVMNSGLGTYRFQVYYKRYNPGAGWSADTMISADLYNQNLNSKYVSLAVDSTGRVYAVWASGATDDANQFIYLKTCVPGAGGNDGWDEHSWLVSVSAPNVVKECPTVAVTPDGHIHITWLEGTAIVYRERVDTLWRAPVTVEGGSNYKAYPAVAGGPDNRVHIVWYGRQGSSGYYDVFYKVRTDTVWGATENVSQGTRHQMYPSIALNPVTGNPHILWQCYGAVDNIRRLVHRWRDAAGWQPTDTVSERNDTLNQETGQIVFTRDGLGHALWVGRSARSPVVTQIRYSERAVNGTWSLPVNITDTSNTRERPSIAGGNGSLPNNLYAVWTDYRDGNAEIYYASASPTQFVGEMPEMGKGHGAGVTVAQGRVYLDALRGPALLVDVTGRTVGVVAPGWNDVGYLQSGVYLLKESGGCAGRLVLIK